MYRLFEGVAVIYLGRFGNYSPGKNIFKRVSVVFIGRKQYHDYVQENQEIGFISTSEEDNDSTLDLIISVPHSSRLFNDSADWDNKIDGYLELTGVIRFIYKNNYRFSIHGFNFSHRSPNQDDLLKNLSPLVNIDKALNLANDFFQR